MGSFALDVARFAAQVPEREKQVIDKVCIDLLTSIVLRTPVGNPSLWKNPPPKGYVGGRLRGNWNVGIGSINTAPRPPAKGGNAPIARGKTAIAGREPEVDVLTTTKRTR